MDYFDVVRERRSVRSFQNKEISNEQIRKLISTSMKAPSAGNLQAYKIIVVRDLSRKKALSDASGGQSFIEQAPVCIVVCADEKTSSHYGERGRTLYSLQDATILSAYLQLTATAIGLATCWVGAFDEKKVSEAINASKDLRPVALISVGYENKKAHETRRRDYDEIVHSEKLS